MNELVTSINYVEISIWIKCNFLQRHEIYFDSACLSNNISIKSMLFERHAEFKVAWTKIVWPKTNIIHSYAFQRWRLGTHVNRNSQSMQLTLLNFINHGQKASIIRAQHHKHLLISLCFTLLIKNKNNNNPHLSLHSHTHTHTIGRNF